MSDLKHLRDVLMEWPDVWREATLWRASLGEPVTAESVGYGYLRHLSYLADAEEVFSALLEAGRFAAAEAALDIRLFIDAAVDRDRLESDLQESRQAMQMEVLGEWDDLARQARLLGLPLDEHDKRQIDAYCAALRDGPAALDLLQPLRQTMADALEARTIALRRRFERAWAATAGEPSHELWRKRVELALTAKRIDVAEALLDAGPDVVLTSAFSSVAPPMPVASFVTRRDPVELCTWSIQGQGGPALFHSQLDPLRHGRQMLPLVNAFLRLSSDAPTASDIASAAAELEKVVASAAVQTPPVVAPFGDGFRTSLRGLGDVACEAFSADAIDLYVEPKNCRLKLPPNPPRPAILMAVDRATDAREGYVVLKPGEVLACVGYGADVTFNLLRILCSQLPPARVLGDSPSNRWMDDCAAEHVPFIRLRGFAERVLRLHGFEPTEALLDRLAVQAFGRPALLHAIVRALLMELDVRQIPRIAVISADVLREAQMRQEYCAKARDELLGPIESVADARLVFAGVLIVFDVNAGGTEWDGVIRRSEVAEWLESEQVALTAERFDAAWRLLDGRGLLEGFNDGSGATLSRQYGGYMAMTLAGNHERYFHAAASGVR
jgi:hypothetical protein